jgi:hypothetical protein
VTQDDLGLYQRTTGVDLSTTDCQRMEERAAALKTRLPSGLPAITEIGTRMRSKVAAIVPHYGAFEALLFGELLRDYAAYQADDGIDSTEADLLLVDLEAQLRSAGVPDDDITALTDALREWRETTDDRQEVRDQTCELATDFGKLFSDLQHCAPKAE